MNLHAQIMNIPAEDHNDLGYAQGHKDARHAAAELANDLDGKLDEAHRQNEGLSTDLEASEQKFKDLEDSYMDLLMSVSRKFDGESRHHTAKRYITEREEQQSEEVQAKKGPE